MGEEFCFLIRRTSWWHFFYFLEGSTWRDEIDKNGYIPLFHPQVPVISDSAQPTVFIWLVKTGVSADWPHTPVILLRVK